MKHGNKTSLLIDTRGLLVLEVQSWARVDCNADACGNLAPDCHALAYLAPCWHLEIPPKVDHLGVQHCRPSTAEALLHSPP